MKRYLTKFNNYSEYVAFKQSDEFVKPNVSHCTQENDVHYNPSEWKYEYLTFEVIDAGTITLTATNTDVAKTIAYSTNNGRTWTNLTTSTEAQELGGILSTGDKVLVKGNNASYCSSIQTFNQFGGTAKVNVYGNIMSLISGDDFADNDVLNERYTFCKLFYQYTNLFSVENLILPATTLSSNCYQYMFQDCTSLTTAPELPAITLSSNCYQRMFAGCTSLVKAPELPAITLASYCYNVMFSGCTSLNYIKAMFTTEPSATYTSNWVKNVTANGTFVKNYAATWTTTGNDGVPSGWTIQTATE